MTTELTKLTRDAIQLSQSMKREWEGYVEIALETPDEGVDDVAETLSKWAKTGIESVRRKILAIQFTHAHLNLSREDILELGQEQTLSRFQKANKAKKYTEKEARLSFVIPGSQAEMVRKSVDRIKGILGISNEEFWDFWLSFWSDLEDNDVKHLAGEVLSKHAQSAVQENRDV